MSDEPEAPKSKQFSITLMLAGLRISADISGLNIFDALLSIRRKLEPLSSDFESDCTHIDIREQLDEIDW